MATWLPAFRLAALGTTAVFSLIALGLSAHITNTTTTLFGGYFVFAALTIATAVLSILTLPVMLVVDILRQGAFSSMIVFELSWLSVLWILWLSSGATAADAALLTFSGCNYRNSVVETACREFAGIQAFAFLSWILLLSYTGTLFVFSIIAANRGHSIWFSAVKDVDFNAPPAIPPVQQSQFDKAQVHVPQVAAQQPAQYPPQSPGGQGWAGQPVQVLGTTSSPYPQV